MQERKNEIGKDIGKVSPDKGGKKGSGVEGKKTMQKLVGPAAGARDGRKKSPTSDASHRPHLPPTAKTGIVTGGQNIVNNK